MDEPTSLSVDAGGDRSSATFTCARRRPRTRADATFTRPPPSRARSFFNEDHTVGNTLRYFLNKKAEVSFVGYSVPHPAEPKMNLRLQTSGPPATDVLLDALSTVHSVGEHVLTTFDAALEEYRRQQETVDAR